MLRDLNFVEERHQAILQFPDISILHSPVSGIWFHLCPEADLPGPVLHHLETQHAVAVDEAVLVEQVGKEDAVDRRTVLQDDVLAGPAVQLHDARAVVPAGAGAVVDDARIPIPVTDEGLGEIVEVGNDEMVVFIRFQYAVLHGDVHAVVFAALESDGVAFPAAVLVEERRLEHLFDQFAVFGEERLGGAGDCQRADAFDIVPFDMIGQQQDGREVASDEFWPEPLHVACYGTEVRLVEAEGVVGAEVVEPIPDAGYRMPDEVLSFKC